MTIEIIILAIFVSALIVENHWQGRKIKRIQTELEILRDDCDSKFEAHRMLYNSLSNAVTRIRSIFDTRVE